MFIIGATIGASYAIYKLIIECFLPSNINSAMEEYWHKYKYPSGYKLYQIMSKAVQEIALSEVDEFVREKGHTNYKLKQDIINKVILSHFLKTVYGLLICWTYKTLVGVTKNFNIFYYVLTFSLGNDMLIL